MKRITLVAVIVAALSLTANAALYAPSSASMATCAVIDDCCTSQPSKGTSATDACCASGSSCCEDGAACCAANQRCGDSACCDGGSCCASDGQRGDGM